MDLGFAGDFHMRKSIVPILLWLMQHYLSYRRAQAETFLRTQSNAGGNTQHRVHLPCELTLIQLQSEDVCSQQVFMPQELHLLHPRYCTGSMYPGASAPFAR